MSAPARHPRVLLVGDQAPERSAPQLSLQAALQSVGVACRHSGLAEVNSTRTWLDLLRQHDVVVATYCYEVQPYVMRQIDLACLMGLPVVRWWVGSDVLRCLHKPDIAANARRFDRLVCGNIAVAPHLTEELAQSDISAVAVPSVSDLSALDAPLPEVLPRGVLVYLPDRKPDFYGRDKVRAAIEAFPDLTFLIVADESHSLAHYPNVRSLGWVEDMEPVWAETGAVLRPTRHDGMPRMLLEALARGRYALYAHSLPGCWPARTDKQVSEGLARFAQTQGPHADGRDAVRRLAADAPERFAATLCRMIEGQSVRRRLRALRHLPIDQWRVATEQPDAEQDAEQAGEPAWP